MRLFVVVLIGILLSAAGVWVAEVRSASMKQLALETAKRNTITRIPRYQPEVERALGEALDAFDRSIRVASLDEEQVRRIVAEEVARRQQQKSAAGTWPSIIPAAEDLVGIPRTAPESRWDTFVKNMVDPILDNPRTFLIPLLIGTVYYLIMLGGILTGSMFEGLDNVAGKKRVRLKELLRHVRTAATWQGVLISPIIFAVMKGLILTDSLSFGMAVVAFENGFFWRATIKKVRDMRERQVSQAPLATTA